MRKVNAAWYTKPNVEPQVTTSLFDSIDKSDHPAIESTVSTEAPLSYADLHAFLRSTGNLSQRGISKNEVGVGRRMKE